MATNTHTTTYLLASLKRRGMAPTSSDAFEESDYLAFADEELRTYVMPLLLSVREEYAVRTEDFDLVSGTTDYDIPSRALGGKLKDVLVATSDGSDSYRSLARVEPRHEADATDGYLLRGNNIVLLQSPTTGGTLRLRYFLRPGRLVSTDACGLITAINAGTQTVTISAAPSDGSFTSTATYDLISSTPGFELLAADQAVTVTGTSLAFASALPDDLAVGDYVALAGESPIPQIPVELHPLLAQRTAVKAMESQGDPKTERSRAVCEEMRKAALTLLSPRVEGASRVVINKYGPGWSWRGF